MFAFCKQKPSTMYVCTYVTTTRRSQLDCLIAELIPELKKIQVQVHMYCTLALMSSCNQILQGARLDHLHVNLVNFKLVRYILSSFSCIAIAESCPIQQQSLVSVILSRFVNRLCFRPIYQYDYIQSTYPKSRRQQSQSSQREREQKLSSSTAMQLKRGENNIGCH